MKSNTKSYTQTWNLAENPGGDVISVVGHHYKLSESGDVVWGHATGGFDTIRDVAVRSIQCAVEAHQRGSKLLKSVEEKITED